MNFRDDKEPWRAGGDNTNANKPVVHYGPRPQEDREYYRHKAESDYWELFYFLKGRIDSFNNSTDTNERQILLMELLSKRQLHFKKHGAISIDCPIAKSFRLMRQHKPPMFLLEISSGLVTLKRVLNEKECSYDSYTSYEIEKLKLELLGHCSRCAKKEPQKSKLVVHAVIPDENKILSFILKSILKLFHMHYE